MITEDTKKITINLDCVISHYFINSNFEFLLPVLHNLKSNIAHRCVILIAEMQTPLSMLPFYSIIDEIVNLLELPKDQIILHTKIRDFTHDRVTVKIFDDDRYYCFTNQVCKIIQNLNFELKENPALFGALFGRPTYPRIMLAHYLETYHQNKSYVTLHSSLQHLEHNCNNLENYYADQLEWYNKRTKKNLHSSDNELGEFNFPRNIETWPDIWGEYLIEIAVETNYMDYWEHTEKTWKCLASGKPFILMHGAGSLKELQKLGFKTFSPWIDESYDKEKNHWNRLEMIKKEIDRLANLNKHDTSILIENLKNAAEYNKQVVKQKYV